MFCLWERHNGEYKVVQYDTKTSNNLDVDLITVCHLPPSLSTILYTVSFLSTVLCSVSQAVFTDWFVQNDVRIDLKLRYMFREVEVTSCSGGIYR